MAHKFAVQLSLIAFAAVSIRGLISGADFQLTLQSALLVLMGFYPFGWILGELARRLVEENVTTELSRAVPPSADPAPPAATR